MAADRLIRDLSQLIGLDDLDAIIELWVLDLRLLDPTQPLFYFSNWSQEDGSGARFGGIEYIPMPVQAQGFEISSNGAPSEPTLTVSNVGLIWTGLVNRWDDLIGCKLIRRRVLRRYLDDGATPSATGAWPDEPWFIEQKQSENKMAVTFALSTAFALDDVKLPKRLALRYSCSWTYRGEGCSYNGYPVADANNKPLPAPLHPAVQAFLDAVAIYRNEANSTYAWAAYVRQAEIDYANSRESAWEFRSEHYDTQGASVSYVYTPPGYAWFPGQIMMLNGVRQPGLSDVLRAGSGDGGLYQPVQVWEWVQGTRDAAAATLNNYRNQQNAAQARANAAWHAAMALKPAADAVRDPRDVCSKTLAGCRLRFADPFTNNPGTLPASMFPGLQIG